MASHALAALLGLSSGAAAAVIGYPGSGKTTLVREADKRGAFPRRLCFDPYASRDRREAERGRKVFPWPGRVVAVRALCERPAQLDRDALSLVVDPGTLDPEDMGQAFRAVAELAWHTGDLALICEEAGLYGRQAADLCLRVTSGGRHAGLKLVFISQSLGRLPIDVRRHTSVIIAFAQSEPRDLDDLAKRAGRGFSDAVSALEPTSPPVVWTQGATRRL